MLGFRVCRVHRWLLAVGFALLVVIASARAGRAAPQISRLSLRGLQAGGITRLVIEGAELTPDPVLHLPVPGVTYQILDGATPKRLEVDFTLPGDCPAGIYLLWVGSATGISHGTSIGIDNLPQLPFTNELATGNVALTGELRGDTVLATKLPGTAGQRLVVEVEAQRLGSKLAPAIHLYDARRTQLAWSRGEPELAGDGRFEVELPADGTYTVEIHDRLFRGAQPGLFRLKIGDFRYANLAYPLGVQSGTPGTFEFPGSNLPADTRTEATLALSDGLTRQTLPAPWPVDVPMLSGSPPAVVVSNHDEVAEAAPAEGLQAIGSVPVAINGRIAVAGETDRYLLAVKPGQKLNFDVLARRAGSALDGVLSIQNEQGAELAANDDRPDTSDPGLEFTVPDGTTQLVLALRDLRAAGGERFVYRLEVTPAGLPSYSLSLPVARTQIPRDGSALVRVLVNRAGYAGPIDLNFTHLPPSVSITGHRIPAHASEALVTLSAPGLSPAQALTQVLGTAAEQNVSLTRRATVPGNTYLEHQPWQNGTLAIGVTAPAKLQLVWDLLASDARLIQGLRLPGTVRVERAAGATGPVRLSLLTTQRMPRKQVTENNQQREVDDVERSLRLETAPTIDAEASQAELAVLVPADLPRIEYDLAIQAELLSADMKQVLATVTTPARRLATDLPISVELATKSLAARAGTGPTDHLQGKIKRSAGIALPVQITLSGLPDGVTAPSIILAAGQTDFDFPVTFAYGTTAGELKDVKVAFRCLADAEANTALHTTELPVALTIVPGRRPAEQPLAVFEDQAEFVDQLTQGGGGAALDSDHKYAGVASVKVTPDQRYNPALPGLNVKIRENPGPGEYRYLRFAWRKQGGDAICLQLNHDGHWGPTAERPGSFRYHAGIGGPCFGASLAIDAALPEAFTVVTRDLFADFGEFTLTGLALSPVDGEHAHFDHIYLGTTVDDFRLVKP